MVCTPAHGGCTDFSPRAGKRATSLPHAARPAATQPREGGCERPRHADRLAVALRRQPQGSALALADEANDNGISYPSQQLLARKCRLSPRRLRDHLQAMEDGGYLERERRSRPNGSRTSDVYRLILDGGGAPP
jgi:hypothetical protein